VLIVPGRAALSEARRARVLARARAACEGLALLDSRWVHLVVTARPLAAAADQVMPVRVRLVRLDESAELEVTERYEERAGGSTLRLHVWQLRAGGLDLRIEGGQVVEAGAAPDLNEQLGRAVAAQLGWTLP